MVQVPFPITSAPGDDPQEGGGRLINVFAERRGDDQSIVWRRVPGLVTFVVQPSVATLVGSGTMAAAGASTS